jgi:integrase
VLINKKINSDPTIHRPTQVWVESAAPEIQEKLAKYGLWKLPSKHTTKELWDTYLDKHRDKKEKTLKTYTYAKNRFFKFFKPNELIAELTQERMLEWRQFLLENGYGEPTVAGTISKAKAVFNWAVSSGMIEKSPLHGVGRGSYRNIKKDRFITKDEYKQLMKACICQEWRVIITLARVGGLHPCEILVLRWSDIYWDKHRFQVFNSKLAQYEGKFRRETPLFPKLAKELEKLRAIPGNENQEYVINRYPNREEINLVTQFNRIAEKAGIGKISRPFDNMRATRSNEICDRFGPAKESEWIGHSAQIRAKHYDMIDNDDYTEASRWEVVQ